jgi:hypothetical protein
MEPVTGSTSTEGDNEIEIVSERPSTAGSGAKRGRKEADIKRHFSAVEGSYVKSCKRWAQQCNSCGLVIAPEACAGTGRVQCCSRRCPIPSTAAAAAAAAGVVGGYSSRGSSTTSRAAAVVPEAAVAVGNDAADGDAACGQGRGFAGAEGRAAAVVVCTAHLSI